MGKHTEQCTIDNMAKVTVTIYMDDKDKEALQRLADAEERSLSQMALLILKQAIRKAEQEGKI
ncbi:ribbon-helix-helix domain-containing protein [Microseira wollei]|uniref:CopG-like ribbon-helix-helix domain-containing protein n=1 Tax=Microseira wollei NIES-4236 TaxID=2530354 RepID=A0AAV3XHW1_9CYAN|nr:ribbon-helix-helix protein, CopG family [Microseira wollei]GET41056.1 hypothetical protein MiSe_58680 [Microseira wollei NIES-4236]